MKRMTYLIVLLLVLCASAEGSNCRSKDISGATTEEDIKLLTLLKFEWMRKANVCQLGDFEIATPLEENPKYKNTIFIFKNGKPVFYRQGGGTYIYSPKLEDAELGKELVHIWHGNDTQDIQRLWYSTVGSDPNITIDDTNFDGQPDTKTIRKGSHIIELYKWNQNGWLKTDINKDN